MPKIRTLDPAWVERLSLSGLSVSARFLYLSAVASADDEGRLLWSVPVAQETLLHSDGSEEAEVRRWMSELESRGLIHAYHSGRSQQQYGWIVDFDTHQRIKRKAKSLLPPPSWNTGVCTPGALPEPSSGSLVGQQGVTLPHHEGTTLPEHSHTIPGASAKEVMTCGNSEITEHSHTIPVALRQHSRAEVELERDLEGENPWSAARSTACGGAPTQRTTRPTLTAPAAHQPASGGSNDKKMAYRASASRAKHLHRHTTPAASPSISVVVESVLQPVASPADVHHTGAVTPDQPETTSRTSTSDLSGAPAKIEDATVLGANERTEPVTDQSLSQPEPQDSLFDVSAEMVKETPAPAGKKKRKQPESWTPDRKDVAHSILRPWWSVYGEGQAQSYGVVFGVIVSCLANSMKPEEITEALKVLGQQRKPISGGTITFALSKTRKQVAEEKTFQQAASSYDVEKYTQREM